VVFPKNGFYRRNIPGGKRKNFQSASLNEREEGCNAVPARPKEICGFGDYGPAGV